MRQRHTPGEAKMKLLILAVALFVGADALVSRRRNYHEYKRRSDVYVPEEFPFSPRGDPIDNIINKLYDIIFKLERLGDSRGEFGGPQGHHGGEGSEQHSGGGSGQHSGGGSGRHGGSGDGDSHGGSGNGEGGSGEGGSGFGGSGMPPEKRSRQRLRAILREFIRREGF